MSLLKVCVCVCCVRTSEQKVKRLWEQQYTLECPTDSISRCLRLFFFSSAVCVWSLAVPSPASLKSQSVCVLSISILQRVLSNLPATLENLRGQKQAVIGRLTQAGEQLHPSHHLFLTFALSFIPVVHPLSFLKFSFLLSVCHVRHLSMPLRFSIPSFALHTTLSPFCFTLLLNYCRISTLILYFFIYILFNQVC